MAGVIIFINGPFGVGKTTTANLLVESLPNAMLYDPEEVGYLLRSVLSPIEERHDFQDYTLWPKMAVEFAGHLVREYGRDLIVPMTLTDKARFEHIVSGLREFDPDIHLFCLTASEDELRRRILSRPESEGGHEWCLSHMESGLKAAHDSAFGTEINTDGRMPEEIAAEMLSSVGLEQIQQTASSAK